MAYHRAVNFMVVSTIAITMACIFSLASAANIDHPPTIEALTIQNNFPLSNLTVQCDSDTEAHSDVQHIVLPMQAYVLYFDPKVQHRCTCTVSTKKTEGAPCSHVMSGKFIIWDPENHSLPMCDLKCSWFVGPDGLSLIQHDGAKPVHVYNGPPQGSAEHNC